MVINKNLYTPTQVRRDRKKIYFFLYISMHSEVWNL